MSYRLKMKQDVFVKHKHVPRSRSFFFFKVGQRSRSQVKIFCMSGKPLSQGTYMPNTKALSQKVQKIWPMLFFSLKQVTSQGQGQRSIFFFFYVSGKPMSQGTYMPKIKALSQMVQKLWPMLKLSNQQTSKQTGQKQYVPASLPGT